MIFMKRGVLMRKVLLYIAQTLDGFIATNDHDLSFLDSFNGNEQIAQSFVTLNERVDVEIMGRKTFDWVIAHGDVSLEHKVYVLSHHAIDHPSAIAYHGDFSELIETLKSQPGKDIWLVGGGEIIKSFIEKDLIDEYQIAILPVMIGDG
ncbi:MAG: dihydrofolate reductase, partial [Bacillota bacterium]